jgi:hypothetical protein
MPSRQFLGRMARYGLVAFTVVAGSLLIGILGYRLTEGMSWLDAYLNAAMILGGMGPVDQLHTTAGKLFAGAYSLFSGIVFLVAAGLLIAPIVHRVLHKFHYAEDSDG